MKMRSELHLILNDFKRNFPVTIFQNKQIYANWLSQTYFFVCHSTPLLGFALPHLKDQTLKHHFEHHIGDEKKHDLLALKDLERLGFNISQFEEHVATQAFYHSQFYRIQFEAATSLLGYILFLEALAVEWGKPLYENLSDYFPESVLFLKIHAEEDPEHAERALALISTLPQLERELIQNNLRYSAHIYGQLVESSIDHKKLLRKVS